MRLGLACFFAVVSASFAQADEAAIARCQAAADQAARIACLEAALRALSAANDAAAVDALGAEQIGEGERRRELDEAASVSAAATGVWADARGLLRIELDNGQVWRQVSSDPIRLRADQVEGETVLIARSGFGGYRLKLDGRKASLRVERGR